jgi:hypothetical protein
MLFKEVIALYCEKDTEHTNTLCVENAQLFHVKASGTYEEIWL